MALEPNQEFSASHTDDSSSLCPHAFVQALLCESSGILPGGERPLMVIFRIAREHQYAMRQGVYVLIGVGAYGSILPVPQRGVLAVEAAGTHGSTRLLWF